jgi:hypothetical protein
VIWWIVHLVEKKEIPSTESHETARKNLVIVEDVYRPMYRQSLKSMKRTLTIVVVLTSGLFSQNTLVAQTMSPTKFKGFLGTYHPYGGTTHGGEGWLEDALT